jgi:predicted  nucleic acid-binding Zn-ribbon protein
MPDINFPNIDLEKAAADFNQALKDAAYVAVGLGVLGFQRAQVQRVELTKQIESQIAALSALPTSLNGQVETYIAAARVGLDELRNQLVRLSAEALPADLPDAAAVRTQLTELAKSVDEAVAPVRQQFEDQLDRLEEVLPQTARDFVQTVRATAASQEQAFRSAVGLV